MTTFIPFEYQNAVWGDAAHTFAFCEVLVDGEWVGYNAASYDTDPRGLELFNRIATIGNALPYIPPTVEQIRETMPLITQVQLRIALLDAGVDATALHYAVGAIPDPVRRAIANIKFQYGSEFRRLDLSVLEVMTLLTFTPSQIDDIWNNGLTVTS